VKATIVMVVFLVAVSADAVADSPTVLISPAAEFLNPDNIQDSIKTECNLPAYQAAAVQRQLEKFAITFTVAEKDQIPASGTYLQLRIENAVSSGHGWVPFSGGHNKYVTTSATLFQNGKEISRFKRQDHSMGGAMGNFKGSCTVLERCADTLGKDVAEWLKKQLPAPDASASAAPAEALATTDKR